MTIESVVSPSTVVSVASTGEPTALGPFGNFVMQTASYLVPASTYATELAFNGSSLTVTLPASAPPKPWYIVVANLNSTSLTLDPNGLDLNGSASSGTLAQFDVLIVWSDGSNYFSKAATSGGGGACGVSGASGVPGLDGLDGSPGTAGGACGVSGVAGACGVSGTAGACGAAGACGVSGVSGVSGTSGVSGVSGVAGLDGLDGSPGQGACGVSGTPGACGVSGISGIGGGACGVSGVSGVPGLDGLEGPAGACGVPGACGISGTAGACGVSGVSGVSGTTGACGISGVSGVSGVVGPAGLDGLDGLDGSPGTAGGACGVSGISGVPGPPGLDGLDGANGIGGQPGATVWHPPNTVDNIIPTGLGYDYEFQGSGTSAPSGWTLRDSATYSEGFGEGTVTGAATAGIAWRLMTVSLPVSWSTAVVKLSWTASSGANFDRHGFIVLDESGGATNGYFVEFGPAADTALQAITWKSFTSTAGTSVLGTSGAFAGVAYTLGEFYLQIVANSSSDWDLNVSPDGINWLPFIDAWNAGAFFTPTEIGFGHHCSNSGISFTSCDFLRVT